MIDGFDPRWDGKSIPERHWHFHRRLFERYAIILGPGEFSDMVKDIKTGRALLVQTRRGSRRVYMVRNRRLWERYFVLVAGERIITALPPKPAVQEG